MLLDLLFLSIKRCTAVIGALGWNHWDGIIIQRDVPLDRWGSQCSLRPQNVSFVGLRHDALDIWETLGFLSVPHLILVIGVIINIGKILKIRIGRHKLHLHFPHWIGTIFQGSRLWWNWQTRYFEVVVGQPVQVQVLLSAPSPIHLNSVVSHSLSVTY